MKVRLQTQPVPKPGETPMFTGVMDCFKKTFQKEGFSGLYKGISSPLAGQMFLYALCFVSYGFGQNVQRSKGETELNLFKIFNAGAFSGIATTVVMTPMELVKIQMQIQYDDGVKKYKNPLDCLSKIYKEKGIQGIYKGTGSTLVRDVPGSGVYFAVYEWMVRSFIPEGGSRKDLKARHFLLSGGGAGLGGWIIMLPLDTVKSRLQAAPDGTYKSMWDCWVKTAKNEGIPAFWKGLPAVMIRAFPANAAMFATVEFTARAYDKWFGI